VTPPVALSGLLPEEIVDILSFSAGYRGGQVFSAFWKGIRTIEDITTLSLAERTRLSERALFRETELHSRHSDGRGTHKIILSCSDGFLIESVLLTDKKGRRTACISTQAGCAMACRFCKTGSIGLTRNLEVTELTEQMLYLRELYGRISHVVFMGMGEPLMNLERVRKAITILSHPQGCNLGIRKIMLSTCGIVDKLDELTARGPYVKLALSLVSADQYIREDLMPPARANRLPELGRSLLRYQEKTKKRITFEYVLLPGINDRPEDIDKLVRFVAPFSYLINVIPWNRVEGLPFRKPTDKEVARFLEALKKRGLSFTRRYSRGDEINGACGQLGGFAAKDGACGPLGGCIREDIPDPGCPDAEKNDGTVER
jgi:23S rRNA (adenine2503-C2)-methyltransferase